MFAMRDMPNWSLPTVVYHADWGTDRNKRWLCKAVRQGDSYRAQVPALVGDHFGSPESGQGRSWSDRSAGVVGFDFPIGIPYSLCHLAQHYYNSSLLLSATRIGNRSLKHFYGSLLKRGARRFEVPPFSTPTSPVGQSKVHLPIRLWEPPASTIFAGSANSDTTKERPRAHCSGLWVRIRWAGQQSLAGVM